MLAALLLAIAPACEAKPAAVAEQSLPTARLAVATAGGARYALVAELALDGSARSRGLMFRKALPDGAGMLFVFPAAQPNTFWMKNTPLSLDMIFVGDDLHIVGIVERATPLSDAPRGVAEPSRYVLEVNGGWCAARGVRAGDRLELVDPVPEGRP